MNSYPGMQQSESAGLKERLVNLREQCDEYTLLDLQSKQYGYIKAWIRSYYPDQMPTYLDVQDYLDQLLESWPGLPLFEGQELGWNPKAPTRHMLVTDPVAARKDLTRFKGMIRTELKFEKYADDDIWALFVDQLVFNIKEPALGLITDRDSLISMMAQISDPVTGRSASEELIRGLLSEDT